MNKMDGNFPAILLLSHGQLCLGLLNTVEMIAGYVDKIEAYPCEEGCDLDEYQENVAALIDKYEGDIVVCVDLKGGTPFNTICKLSSTRKLLVMAEMNLSMILELAFTRYNMQGEELVEYVAQRTKSLDFNVTEAVKKFYKG